MKPQDNSPQAQTEQTTPNLMSAYPASLDNELPEPYNLTFFVVSNNFDESYGRHQRFISPFFATVDQAYDFKDAALAEYPYCFVMGHVAYYRSEDDSNRLELLASIVPAISTQAALLNQLQQDIDKTISALSSQQQAAFTEALERIQKTHDYLLEHIDEGGIEQMAGILSVQLDEILVASKPKAQNQQA